MYVFGGRTDEGVDLGDLSAFRMDIGHAELRGVPRSRARFTRHHNDLLTKSGHAVTRVMYVFGGRTDEGVDLGDLSAFRISTRRWYSFQNPG
jgi:hypothetical protein